MYVYKKITKQEFTRVVKKSKTMAQASRELGIPPTTFRRIAKSLQIYNPNPGEVGSDKKRYSGIPLSEILIGNYPNCNSSRLKARLVAEGYKENKCEMCGITEWNGKEITLQTHHIDGNPKNHKLENLMIVCPNCHSQTESYSGKGQKRKRKSIISDHIFIDALNNSYSITEALNKIGISSDSAINYKKAESFLKKSTAILLIKEPVEDKYCGVCGISIYNKSKSNMCNNCYKRSTRKIMRPPYEQLLSEIDDLGYCGTGKKYGVSDNAIRKWVKRYEKEKVT
jgi:transposase-like protein